MSPAVVVTLILVIGVALVVAAAVADRRANAKNDTSRQLARADQSGPAASPTYISSDQLLDQAPPAAVFTPDQERALAAQLATATTTRIDTKLAAPTLATHTGGRAILNNPRVLVCGDQIGQIRELLPILSAAHADRQPLVIAAPAIDADTLQTIIANKLAGTIEVAVVLGGDEALRDLTAATGSPLTSLRERQAGGITTTQLGRPARFVADPEHSWIIPE